jgi:hypothetical protein
MHTNIAIFIPIHSLDDSRFPRPDKGNYDYWALLMGYFLMKSDTIEIHCWTDENEAINELYSLEIAGFELTESELEHIVEFKAVVTTEVMDIVLKHHVNQKGKLKWFTVNLDSESNSLFHSGHWGTELVAFQVNDVDIEYIKSVVPKGTTFDIF